MYIAERHKDVCGKAQPPSPVDTDPLPNLFVIFVEQGAEMAQGMH